MPNAVSICYYLLLLLLLQFIVWPDLSIHIASIFFLISPQLAIFPMFVLGLHYPTLCTLIKCCEELCNRTINSTGTILRCVSRKDTSKIRSVQFLVINSVQHISKTFILKSQTTTKPNHPKKNKYNEFLIFNMNIIKPQKGIFKRIFKNKRNDKFFHHFRILTVTLCVYQCAKTCWQPTL